MQRAQIWLAVARVEKDIALRRAGRVTLRRSVDADQTARNVAISLRRVLVACSRRCIDSDLFQNFYGWQFSRKLIKTTFFACTALGVLAWRSECHKMGLRLLFSLRLKSLHDTKIIYLVLLLVCCWPTWQLSGRLECIEVNDQWQSACTAGWLVSANFERPFYQQLWKGVTLHPMLQHTKKLWGAAHYCMYGFYGTRNGGSGKAVVAIAWKQAYSRGKANLAASKP